MNKFKMDIKQIVNESKQQLLLARLKKYAR